MPADVLALNGVGPSAATVQAALLSWFVIVLLKGGIKSIQNLEEIIENGTQDLSKSYETPGTHSSVYFDEGNSRMRIAFVLPIPIVVDFMYRLF